MSREIVLAHDIFVTVSSSDPVLSSCIFFLQNEDIGENLALVTFGAG